MTTNVTTPVLHAHGTLTTASSSFAVIGLVATALHRARRPRRPRTPGGAAAATREARLEPEALP